MTRVSLVSPRSLVSVIVSTVLALWLGAVLQSTPATPQQPPAAPIALMLTIVDVKPDMMADYVALQKNETIPNLQKGGVEWRDAWRAGFFGTTYTVAYVTPLASFARLDGPTPIEKAVGADGARAYEAKIAKMVASMRRYALRDRADLGYRTEGGAMPKLGVLASVEVITGRQPEFETILKNEWAPALKKAGVPSYSVSQVMLGGAITEYYTFTPLENFAQLDKGHPIQQSLGEAGMNQLLAKMGATIHHAERIVIRYDDELSFRTKTTSQAR
jgi:hypothetical protein